jgi:hypothetical protein
MRRPFRLGSVVLTLGCLAAAEHDFGPNVLIFEPAQADTTERIRAVFAAQERAQFGRGRYALLFKPGRYAVDVPVGFYTHVAGLGQLPGDVTIAGRVWTDAAWMKHNATCNFWRAMENLTVHPPDRVNIWAVSQAAPMRRVLVRGDLHLSSQGYSSGGFMADCRILGVVHAGSQQQWLSRNSGWNEWQGVNWNMVFVGCENPPAGDWPSPAVTRVAAAPVVREKPYLTVEDDRWFVHVPPLREGGTAGLTWATGQTPGQAIPLEHFHIAKEGRDTAATINAALQAGRHLLVTPGIYPVDAPLVVSRTGTIILGLGFPTFTPTTGKTALRVDATEGVIVSGLLIDAGTADSDTLVQIGAADRPLGRADNPAVLHDLFCRVGGATPGRARTMLAIHASHVIGDNLWLWRADHGANVGWTENTCDTGLLVTGDDVTVYGLFVEHTQKHQTLWHGERGRVFFYQSEMPYDPPSQAAWRSSLGDGYASYKIADHVVDHEAWGLGVYHFFRDGLVVAENAIESGSAPGIALHHLFTYRLYGGKPGSGIRHVVNGRGGETIIAEKSTVK